MKLFFTGLLAAFVTLMSFNSCQKQTITRTVTDTLVVHDTTTKIVHDTAVRTLTVKPGPDDGQDCLVASIPLYASANLKGNPDIGAGYWTFAAQGYGAGSVRSYLEFVALDGLPDSAYIRSAKLYLYGLPAGTGQAFPQGNSIYPGSPYSSYTDNSCWLKRVTANWNLDSITWNNMPATTDVDRVAIPASTAQWAYNATVDVTQLIQDIVYSRQNYGFAIQLQNEQIYRSLGFAGSRNADSTLWPKLVINYSVH